jgi:hypothetical protein
MAKPKSDPKGHSLRIYSYIFDSAAFAALSPYDVMAYLALLRELKGYNNGDLSLTLSRAKKHGIKHHITLAKSLRALCAVGLVAVTRRGGCTKGGQRLPNLYRLTDRICYPLPAKYLEAQNETNEWRKVTTKQQGLELIEAAELAVKAKVKKTNSLSHAVTTTTSSNDLVDGLNTSTDDVWTPELGQEVTYGKKSVNPVPERHVSGLHVLSAKGVHRTPHVSPLYVATLVGDLRQVHEWSNYKLTTNLSQPSQGEVSPDSVGGEACRKLADKSPQTCNVENALGKTHRLNVNFDDLT